MKVFRAVYSVVRTLVAAALLVASVLVLWQSQDLILWLIHRVGEERALGVGAVVREPGGGVLLTNPAAMLVWTLPFWGLSTLLLAGGTLLLLPCGRCAGRELDGDEQHSPA